MALSVNDIAYIRLMAGDNCLPYVVDAASLTVLENELGAVDNCVYIVKILEARLGNATRVSGIDANGQAVANPSMQGIVDALDRWRSACPGALSEMATSTLHLGIDEDWDDA